MDDRQPTRLKASEPDSAKEENFTRIITSIARDWFHTEVERLAVIRKSHDLRGKSEAPGQKRDLRRALQTASNDLQKQFKTICQKQEKTLNNLNHCVNGINRKLQSRVYVRMMPGIVELVAKWGDPEEESKCNGQAIVESPKQVVDGLEIQIDESKKIHGAGEKA